MPKFKKVVLQGILLIIAISMIAAMFQNCQNLTPPSAITPTNSKAPDRQLVSIGTVKINPELVDFGQQQVNTVSAMREVWIKNDSDSKVEIKNLLFTGVSGDATSVKSIADFERDYLTFPENSCVKSLTEDPMNFTLNAHTSCVLRVAFHPKSAGVKQIHLSATYGIDNEVISMQLRGAGTAIESVTSVN